MKVGIVGASAAGLYAAILLAKRHPDFHVVVIEKNDKPGKKLLATGNGHCNLFNTAFAGSYFNHPAFIDALLERYPASALLEELHGLGIATFEKDGLVYPLSFSASAHVRYLMGLAHRLGIEFRFEEKVIGVKGTRIETNRSAELFDHVIYAFGGCSQANLGSDGSLFPLLKKNGYHVVEPEPSLCPIRSHDVPKSLFGVRHKCKLSLTKNKNVLYEEFGEVLFKKDGLSGIATMNASSRFEKGSFIVLDLFPEYAQDELEKILLSSMRQNPDDFLAPIIEKPLADFSLQKCKIYGKTRLTNTDISQICAFLKHMEFAADSKYDFESSQVTRGGIDLRDVDLSLRSKVEPGVSFIGECLDIDGMCGGFNLGWALLSAKVAIEVL